MMLFSLSELIDLAVMTVVVGYIFKDMFRHPKTTPENVLLTMEQGSSGAYEAPKTIDLESYFRHAHAAWYDDLLFSIAVTAPGIALHEMGHKFMAMALGLQATFHASYFGLALGVVLKLLASWIIFIPGYVVPIGVTSPLQMALIAFAGPGVNLMLWLGAGFCLKKGIFRGHEHVLVLTREINRMLFIFNMLPLPIFDGFKVYEGLIRALMGAV